MDSNTPRSVLFVDDEPSILEGLRRMLHRCCAGWDLRFERDSGAAAMLLKEREVDVLVTDMRMPGMDGAALLEAAKLHSPGTVRIVLSGHTDPATAVRVVSLAHQFLAKPCDPQRLLTAIGRTCRVRDRLESQFVRDALSALDGLPVIPTVYQELRVCLADGNANLDAIANILRNDGGLCAKILQLVNSSFFGLSRAVQSLSEAIAYLGTATLESVVLSAGILSQLADQNCVQQLEREQRHALLVTEFLHALLDRDEGINAREAFMAGMMHDIARLVPALNADPTQSTHELPDHGLLSAYLLELWGAPFSVVEAVAFHHKPSVLGPEPGTLLCGKLHIADILAREIAPVHDTGDAEGIDAEFLQQQNFAPDLGEYRDRSRHLLPAHSES